ncbi:MAG TPA: pitrilysin family protein [Candidatus Eisenbacteria bacterium]|jgi:zinc protease
MTRSHHSFRGARVASLLVVLVVSSLVALSMGGCLRGGTAMKTPQIKLDFEKYKLANGLEVILRKDNRLPIVAVNVWYHVGPAKETAGRTGFAHLFEHMMFQGSGHVGEDMHFKYLEGAGASFVNGTTSYDRTNYLEDVPANQLELALWLESDRMGFLLDRLDQSMLANQQDVVRNERRQSVENRPYGLGEEEVSHQLYPAGHPYYADVIGSHEDIQAAKLQDVRDFFTQYYAPNNATLAIVGDLDVEKTKALVEKYFGTIAKGPDVAPVNVQTPVIGDEKRAVVTDQVELPRVYMAWITAPFFKPGDAEADIAARILGGGKASRLYKSLVYEKKIAQDASAYQQSAGLSSIFQIRATAKPGHTADELAAAIDHELDSLATDGPTPDELAAAKNAIHTSIVTSLENVGSFGGVADRLQTYNHYTGDPGYLNHDLERYTAVTAQDVKALVAGALAKNHRVVVQVQPGEKIVPPAPPTPPAATKTAAKVESKEPWRNEVPKPGPLSTAPLPSAKRFSLSNGLAVYLVENHALPVVAAELAVRAGSAADLPELPGLAGFSIAMLDEGTAKRDALTIARDLERLGASLGSNTVRDGSSLSVHSLKQNAEKSLEILADVALAPTFPAEEVERVRNDRLTALLQERDSPFRIAGTVMWTDLYGSGHPYGHMAIGTEPGLKRISRADLETFYKSAFTPANGALVLAGDLTESEAKKLANEAFGKWSGQGSPKPRTSELAAAPEKVLIVDKPKMPQTALMVAQVGVPRSSPDFEKLNVMNQILGGLFTSRINLNLRERHGYSYGAFSTVYENTGAGPIMVGSQVRADVTGASVAEVMKEVHGMLEKEVSADELQLAKESISRSLPALFETSQSTAGTIADLYMLDLPPDYYQELPTRINAMTAAEVYEATRRHLSPDQMKVIAVGDRKLIDRQIGALKLGQIGYRLPDGRPVGEEQAAKLPVP